MDLNRFIDQAKGAAKKAKDMSSEAAQAVKDSGEKLAETGKEKAASASSKAKEMSTEASQAVIESGGRLAETGKGKAREVASKAKEMSTEASQAVIESGGRLAEAGKGKAQETLELLMAETAGLRPILNETGFIIGDLAVTFTIPPEIHIGLSQTGHGSKSLEQILVEKGDSLSTLQRMTVKAIIKAYQFDTIAGRYGYRLGDLELVMTIPPEVTINLVAGAPQLSGGGSKPADTTKLAGPGSEPIETPQISGGGSDPSGALQPTTEEPEPDGSLSSSEPPIPN